MFSPKTGGEFLEYLRNLRDSVTLEHVSIVEELYGSNAMQARRRVSGVGEYREIDCA